MHSEIRGICCIFWIQKDKVKLLRWRNPWAKSTWAAFNTLKINRGKINSIKVWQEETQLWKHQQRWQKAGNQHKEQTSTKNSLSNHLSSSSSPSSIVFWSLRRIIFSLNFLSGENKEFLNTESTECVPAPDAQPQKRYLIKWEVTQK